MGFFFVSIFCTKYIEYCEGIWHQLVSEFISIFSKMFCENLWDFNFFFTFLFLREWWCPWKGPTHARRFNNFVLIIFRMVLVFCQIFIKSSPLFVFFLSFIEINLNLGGISSSILSVFFTDNCYKLLKSLHLISREQICQWKTLTKRLMKCPPGLGYISL